ncbi:MAG: hypothetical protein COW24_02125 [Candidatus Kerfeldbacteria bacterium CG15_BIG_FIL_POST_REV_8_21_14_020_45_12]|uniref:RecF/RecN/SMC N-terminal domain-containing protein n=1 Tax=Candidatus Kerfeldbacteria bacterium CG15_BIG_FIL_POST_REV_8_21_14_020_45_12 TaxID=2014247 RepID=A0A2M7H483_9BACT|nr:MAG: hypothetical protein COW24_02125 [Candidatus Kerfeldbacteria bacterium CG15_BIG_FIL_POST_REV_8_21_14_020_45_12]PJA94041.1 MAG: hypothetical protein CO132_00200 [Candidatus Kerfeldbacteria bacterium CG_4_9_14_3_um_filter_45_8]
MRLEKLVLQGFKSFADKTSFDFTKNFTAIVGPNGSGKSNVSDAIRWVLGEQSMKLLRGKSSTDLIFGGSDTLAKMGMAQVELHLDNADGLFPLEYQEVVISRKMFGDGESEYRINGSKVRLQDILMLLAQAKFGQKSYAVIGQGMITQFLSATPQERKLFFDEATGVKEYQIKRDQAINKLIRTEDNLVQSEALLQEIEPHLKSLERQVKRLEKREKLEIELRDFQIGYYGSIWNELGIEFKNLEAESKAIQQEITTKDAELTELQGASDALAGEASRGERYQQLQQLFNDLLEKKSHLLKEQAVLKGKLEVEHERQGELSLIWLQRKEDELMSDVHAREAELRTTKQKLTADATELTRKDTELEAVKGEFRAEEFEIIKLREQIEQQTHAMSVPQITSELTTIFEEQEQFLRRLLQTQSMNEFKETQAAAKDITKKLATLMDRLTADERDTVESLRVEMKQKEQLLERLTKERETLQNRINDLRVNIASAENSSTFLHSQLTRMQDELSNIQSSIDETERGKDANSKSAQAEEYSKELLQFDAQIERLDKQLVTARADIDSFNQEEENKKTELVSIQSKMRTVQRHLNTAQQKASTIDVNLARVETRQEDVQNELQRDIPEDLHAEIMAYDPANQHLEGNRDVWEKKIISLQHQLDAIGNVDAETITEYESTKERFEFLDEQINDLSSSIGKLEGVIDELDKTIKTQFQKNFKKINDGFQEYFKVLFGGGKAKLELLTETEEEKLEEAEAEKAVEAAMAGAEVSVDVSGESLHDEKERELIGKKKKRQKVVAGIDVYASPPSKKVHNINALSGGEKSLVTIALLCAIIANNPSPFVVLDEVEAALDEENSEKLAAIIKDLSNKTQIVIITHNRVTMRAANVLYGVTMGSEGKSHILSVELTEAEEMIEADEATRN